MVNRMDVELPIGYVVISNITNLHYKITKVLGSGGFGITYGAVCMEHNYTVAVKELFPAGVVYRAPDYTVRTNGNQQKFIDDRNSFIKEIQVLYNLNSLESAVKIYDYFPYNNTAYYVMEFVNGDTLLDYIKRAGLMVPSDWSTQIRQLMRDIDMLHKNGVIHRDISPDNIKLTPDKKFKLIDFGSARNFEGGQNFTVNLKVDFAPIEQYSTSGQGAYTDVYTLAATLYYCFTGRLVINSIQRQERDELTPPTNLGAKLTKQQERALLKALAVLPKDRYQTMKEFEEAFFYSEKPKERAPERNLGEKIQASVSVLKNNMVYTGVSGALVLIAIAIQFLL